MRRSHALTSLLIAFFASSIAACGAQVEIESKDGVSAGSIKDSDKGASNTPVDDVNNGPECVQGTLQHPTCVDPGDLKMEAHDLCQQSNMVLTDLRYEATCDGWKADSAEYECCAATTAPPYPPPPPVPGEGCTLASLGDEQTCQDLSNFKQLAYDACTLDGLQLVGLYFPANSGSCGPNEGSTVEYQCCPAPPPPVPPVTCLEGTLGDGQTCQDLGDVKLTAYNACADAGLVLFDLQIADPAACNPNEWLLVTYKCTASGNVCP